MNKDNYKSAIDQIHASEELKEKTFENIKFKKKLNNRISYMTILASCAVIVFVFSAGLINYNQTKNINTEIAKNNDIKNSEIEIAKSDLPRFKNIKELKKAIPKSRDTNDELKYSTITDSIATEKTENETIKGDFSTTNTQVENVDEADIVKTDGKYIYYVCNGSKIIIVDADNLKIISEIKNEDKKQRFSPYEIYINNNKLIALGNYYEYQETITNNTYLEDIDSIEPEYKRENVIVKNIATAKAIVYDISDIENPKIVREVGLDGYYSTSRMIGDNIYFVSRKSVYYYDGMKDEELLPVVFDTELKNEQRIIQCTEIAYFGDTNENTYTIVGGFNINNKENVNVETFFGASDTVYASENNLYITQNVYKQEADQKIDIYKFELNNSKILLKAKGEVAGSLNNQFSIDEYNGNLRIATTVVTKPATTTEEVNKETGITTTTLVKDRETANNLYILDENLKEIGKIENMAVDERIYSVRFIGDIGYLVTFKQVDPLFVIDLSDPTNPVIKGQLKIPGYSSYLHPYDETHIIGIGYNTKETAHGGTRNDSLKMSMFDVSDLENPKEIFNVNIDEGSSYISSNIIYNHKALFYNKNKNLIGFPLNGDRKTGAVIFKIDLEKGFENYGEISDTSIDRMIYIGDKLYTLSYNKIRSYDLNSLEKIDELTIE